MDKSLNILIDNSSYDLLNSGDIAMAKICIERVHELQPEASLIIITESINTLTIISEHAKPIDIFLKRKIWAQERNIFGALFKLIPKQFHKSMEKIETDLQLAFPQMMTKWIYRRLSKRNENAILVKEYMQHIDETDIAIASGGGFMTDAFEDHAIRMLEMFYLIKKQNKPVAMFGQGVGPVTSTKLLATMRKVLPTLDLICVREGTSSLPLLLELGVSPENILITGDDAIELSKPFRKKTIGTTIGFNIRVAAYATMDNTQAKLIANIVKDFANEKNTVIIPAPISWYPSENDLEQINSVIDLKYKVQQQAPHEIENLLNQISTCRVVITGSYHAAVFALGLGIPIIGLAKSKYYVEKFIGLAGMFKTGVQVVCCDNIDWQESLQKALISSWDDADNVRRVLLHEADEQIISSNKAYEYFFHKIHEIK